MRGCNVVQVRVGASVHLLLAGELSRALRVQHQAPLIVLEQTVFG